MDELSTLDKEDVFKVLLPQLSQAQIELYVAADLFVSFEEYREQILSALRKYAGNIEMKDIPQIMKMRNMDQRNVDNLLDLWQNNGRAKEAIVRQIKGEGRA